jgi:hypothetical protein
MCVACDPASSTTWIILLLVFYFSDNESFFFQNGVERGVESFYRHLPLLNMRCDLDPTQIAVWWSTEHVSPLFVALRRIDQ